jgi:SAM-dependent methyltransferase
MADDACRIITGCRVNIGCGRTPTPGWVNFDNSYSVSLANYQRIVNLLAKLKLINEQQYEFIARARETGIVFADASKKIPLPDGSVEVLYTSHMLEHMTRADVTKFLRDVYRVLMPGGIIRIAVPDIGKLVNRYLDSGDADAFIEGTYLSTPGRKSFLSKLKCLLVGDRHHLWMYDGRSLSKLLTELNFRDPVILPPGKTMIKDPQSLNLSERAAESVYVEARK